MKQRHLFDNLRMQLVAVFGLLVVVLAVSLAALAGAQISKRVERQRGLSLQENAGDAARELARRLQDRTREITVLAAAPDIWRDRIDSTAVRAVLDRTRAISPANTWIGVADLDGNLRAATGGVMVGSNVRDRPWFAPGRRAPHVGDLYPAELLAAHLPPQPDGAPLHVVDVAAPITARDGRVLGVLVSSGSWPGADKVVKAMAPPDAGTRQVETFIYDRAGKMIHAPGGRLGQLPADQQSLPPDVRLDQTAFTSTWKDGVSYLASAVRLPPDADAPAQLGWLVLSRQPTKIVMAGAREAAVDVLQLGGLAAAIAAVTGWFVAQRLTRPLRTLSLAAHRVAAKETGARIPVLDGGTAEVRQLSLALVEMTDELNKTNQALEQRVRERTDELANANRQLEQLASTDPLTGLLNRRGLALKLQSATGVARRDGSALSLLLVDADHFKRVNDTHGHEVGDATLTHIAQVMKARLRDGDMLARLGGEEFVALLPQTDAAAAQRVADGLVDAIAEQPAALVGRITVSVGVAQVSVATDDGSRALRRADAALYRAKSAGRNRSAFEASAVSPL